MVTVSASIDFVPEAEQLALNASPYNVPSVGTVARPHGVDVDALMRDAASIRGTKPWNAPGRPSGEVRGLFIGINYYGTSAQLSGCCNDVKQVLGTLQKCGMPITSANILVDEDGFPGRSGQPTRHNILRHLAWLVLGAKPGDVLFLFFSGHGTQTKALHDAAEEFDQCLLPVDYEKNGCILDNDIHKVLLSRLPAGVRLTAVFDCCHSGTMMDLAFKYACSASSAPQCGGHMERIREGNDVKADVLMVSGCEDDQTSADVHDTATLGTGSTGAGGAITQCLTYMIQNRTTASYRDLFHATRDMLHRKGYTQIPQLCASKPLDLQQQFSLMNKFVTDKSVA
ncbi:Caspase domain [Trypanosoma vivax]|nr:Caspase domain [Trypanosoma vivax]KAH8604009.1 Caspase domain [Trypanosoma vivax]KAH8604014.1 Caspase domain [Trypanosoma vivax]KAH8604020.1 Caspase domain [Trypanosoma vivax]KAH8604029.1 Caspase domain [Trypanosoma vivax]